MTRSDVVLKLLESKGYTMNPGSFEWRGSNDSTYQALWYICSKLSQRGTTSRLIRDLMAGRTSEGYLSFVGSKPIRDESELPRLTNDPLIADFLLSASHHGSELHFMSEGREPKTEPLESMYTETSLEEAVMRNNSEALSASLENIFPGK